MAVRLWPKKMTLTAGFTATEGGERPVFSLQLKI